ncbi:MAG: divalent-cation tolerance protein CutA [Nanoarchaeota archaeon]
MLKEQLIMVETTVASEPVARRIASVLVDKKLAACVHINAVESHYKWKNTIKMDKEFCVRATTTQARVVDCINEVRKEHPYELPAIIVLPIVGSNKPYADWVAEYVKQ